MRAIIFRALLATILTVCFPVAALACSFAPTHYPWIPKYKIYSHLNKTNPLGEYDFIGIVTGDLTPVEEERFNYYYGNNRNAKLGDYANVKFQVLETLKGSEEDNFFQGSNRKIFSKTEQNADPKVQFEKSIIRNPNKLSDPLEIIEYNRAKEIAERRTGKWIFGSEGDFHKRADFRDLFDLSKPQLKRAGGCGNTTSSTIFEGLTYLAFKSGDEIIHLEPVNPENDSLVDWVRDELAGTQNDYMIMSFQKLFNATSSNRYAVIEITQCSSQDEVLRNVEEKLPFMTETETFNRMSRKSSLSSKLKYAEFDVLVGNVKHRDVSLGALEAYMRYVGVKNFQCEKGGQYFAFGRSKDSDLHNAYSGFRSQSDLYNWRFMRIENEYILLEDFQTNLQLTGPQKLHLSKIIK